MKMAIKLENGKLYKLRCRENGILVTNKPEFFNVVWVRDFSPELGFGIDHLKEWDSNKRVFVYG